MEVQPCHTITNYTNLYYSGRERMAREPGVALLVIASGSQIKLEFETLKAQYISRKLYL